MKLASHPGWILGAIYSQEWPSIVAAQGGGGGTEGRGQWVGWNELGLDLGNLEIFSNLSDSMKSQLTE